MTDRTIYVCQQCRLRRWVDCRYLFHPAPPPDHDRYREAVEAAE